MGPLTAQFFKDNIEVIGGDIDGKDISLKTYTTRASTYGTGRTLKSITLSFRDIHHNATIFFPYELCDKNGNKAGMLELTFVDEESGGVGRRDSHWDAAFVTQ